MSRDSTISAQLAVGLRAHERHFGRQPTSFWLPECGYRPAQYEFAGGHAQFRPGLESFLERFGIRAFFADSSAVSGGTLSDVQDDRLSSYARGLSNLKPVRRNLPGRSTAWPYLVSDSDVAVFGRDDLTSRQVWSATEGYPGHAAYREFHKRDAISGMRFWRITGPRVALGDKVIYDPEQAFEDVRAHVDHFVDLVAGHVIATVGDARVPPAVVSPYDTELFGHWWFEGVEWLKQVLRRLATHEQIELTTPTDYLERYPPTEKIGLLESSWGAGSDARTWLNDDTRWMWPIIHDYEVQMEQLVRRFPRAEPQLSHTLDQVARELLLVESSDWPFLVTTGQAAAYASARFRSHAARYDRLVDAACAGRDPSASLSEIEALDNPFPDVDYRTFAELKG